MLFHIFCGWHAAFKLWWNNKIWIWFLLHIVIDSHIIYFTEEGMSSSLFWEAGPNPPPHTHTQSFLRKNQWHIHPLQMKENVQHFLLFWFLYFFVCFWVPTTSLKPLCPSIFPNILWSHFSLYLNTIPFLYLWVNAQEWHNWVRE